MGRLLLLSRYLRHTFLRAQQLAVLVQTLWRDSESFAELGQALARVFELQPVVERAVLRSLFPLQRRVAELQGLE